MRIGVCVFLSVLFILLVSGAMWERASATHQEKKAAEQAPTNSHEVSPEARNVLDEAGSASPELGADALIKLAEVEKKASIPERIEWLTNAFYLAAQAEQSVKKASMPGAARDTRSGSLSGAFSLNLDKLSLQSRIINDMLPLAPRKARVLLEEIQFPQLSPVTCQEPLSYDPSLFYQTIGRVIQDGFSAEDKRKGRHIAILAQYIGSLQSHSQVKPAARLVIEMELSPSDFGQLANRFANAISQLRGDERSFASGMIGPGPYTITGSIAAVIEALDHKGLPDIVLLKALREYLVSNLSARPCGEMASGDSHKSPAREAIKYFNQTFRSAIQNSQIAAIGDDELKGMRVGEMALVQPYWQSTQAKQLLVVIKKLRFGDGDKALPVSSRETVGWLSKLTDFLIQLEAWTPSAEEDPNFFHEKCVLYESLVDLIPSGQDRSKVIDSFVNFLGQNSTEVSRIEWLEHVDNLILRTRGADSHEEVLRTFSTAGDPSLNLYAHLELLELQTVRPARKQ